MKILAKKMHCSKRQILTKEVMTVTRVKCLLLLPITVQGSSTRQNWRLTCVLHHPCPIYRIYLHLEACSMFCLISISCIVVYGCVQPFNNIASGIILERNYFLPLVTRTCVTWGMKINAARVIWWLMQMMQWILMAMHPFGKLYAAGIAHVHSHSSERRKSMIFRQSGIMILITLITWLKMMLTAWCILEEFMHFRFLCRRKLQN